MIQIFLDGKQAIPRENASLKLTSENPYFTKSASYTYDVELPLGIAENRDIFGWLHRMDVKKESRILDAVLIVDNVTMLTGSAHITSVSETSVKVQLLGEASSYNYGNKMDDTYIDELDLGDWYMTTWPDGSYWGGRGRPGESAGWQYYPEGTKLTGTNTEVLIRANCIESGYDHSGEALLNNLFSGEYPWVALPILNSSADFLCNGYAYRFTSSANNSVKLFLRNYEGSRGVGRRPSDDPPVASFAIQPYVWVMAEKVAKATGFIISREDNAIYNDPFLRRIIIANANNYIECNKCLPHWSVNEWWTQIEQTFGLVMTIDYSHRKITLRKRADHYTSDGKVLELTNVLDEYSADVEDESEDDISSNNVGFADFDNGPEDLLSDFIIGNASYNDDFNSIDDLLKWAKTQTMTSFKNVIFRCKDAKHYIYSSIHNRIEEVDMFRARIVNDNKSDIDIELKIVPARFIEYECNIYPYIVHAPDGSGTTTADVPLGSFPVQILQTPNIAEMDWYKENYDDQIDIDSIINDDGEESRKETSAEDVLYIAIADLNHRDSITATVDLTTGKKYSGTFKYPRAFLRERTIAPMDGNPYILDPGYSLSLIPIQGQTNLASKTLSDGISIDTTVRHCMKFVVDKIPDPGAIFLIHNKRFVCEKIETDISSAGLKKLLTGYFYEIDL